MCNWNKSFKSFKAKGLKDQAATSPRYTLGHSIDERRFCFSREVLVVMQPFKPCGCRLVVMCCKCYGGMLGCLSVWLILTNFLARDSHSYLNSYWKLVLLKKSIWILSNYHHTVSFQSCAQSRGKEKKCQFVSIFVCCKFCRWINISYVSSVLIFKTLKRFFFHYTLANFKLTPV